MMPWSAEREGWADHVSSKKIFIIDDEPDLTLLMEGILEGVGSYEVFVAHDGQEGKKKSEKTIGCMQKPFTKQDILNVTQELLG